jgi:hypothetical protein
MVSFRMMNWNRIQICPPLFETSSHILSVSEATINGAFH